MGNDSGTPAFSSLVEIENEAELEKAIEALLARMSLGEKLNQMTGNSSLISLGIMAVRYGFMTFDSGKNRRWGIPALKFTDGPRGICLNHSTCFPVSMARGATWDTELQQRVGSALGIEARAQGATFYGGICINVLRHPGWGRAQETFGEDPYHLGAIGVATVNGVQRHVMGCAKHLACNSIEESRFHVDVRIDDRALREIYLPHFQKCVDAGVACVMSAYNKVNGTYCGHNAPLLRDILKAEWGFKGFVMSDFVQGVRNGKAGAVGGLDMEMPKKWHFGVLLRRAVKKGNVPMGVIDEAAGRVIRQKARFVSVGEAGPYGRGRVASREHADLALEVARKGIVLLKNEDAVLPLDRNSIKKIAVIGELADVGNIGDKGSSLVAPPYVVTPLEGIRDRAGSVEVVFEDGKNLEKAKRAAREADAVILVAGLTFRDEGEYITRFKSGGDRDELNLSSEQEGLIEMVAEQNDRCVVVLEGGSAITMEAWKDRVAAIVMAWYPGMEGGNAIADVLFGDVNPGGKLPIVFPKSADQLPFFDRKARSIEYGYYHGYRLFDKKGLEPAFPFGFGLSYTRFSYGNLRLNADRIGKNGEIAATVDITNTGERAGDEIAQLYVGYEGSKVDRPVRDLKGFARISLEPGETKTASFKLPANELAYYDVESRGWEIEEIEYVVYAGPSSKNEDLTLSDSFRIAGS